MSSRNTDHWLEPINRPGVKNLDEWEVIKQDLRQEEINHPQTVYQRAFIPGWDDQAGYRDSFRLNAYGCPFFIAHTGG